MPAPTFYSSTEIYDRVIKRLEAPVVAMFALASHWLPKPTYQNTNKRNAHTLITMRDMLLERWNMVESRRRAFEGMFNFIISKYDRDNVNGGYLDDLIAELKRSEWIFRKEATKDDLLKALEKKQFDKVMDLIE